MKFRSISLLLIAEVAAMSLWFVSAAILPDMAGEASLSPARQAALSSGVQLGFVIGALVSAIMGIADRFDPRRVFFFSAVAAGLINSALLVTPPGGTVAILARVLTGALMAGVYPVGMKIMATWTRQDRGLAIGLLVGALVIGSASPHMINALGGVYNWQPVMFLAAVSAITGGLIAAFFVSEGPYLNSSSRFNWRQTTVIFRQRDVMLANILAALLRHNGFCKAAVTKGKEDYKVMQPSAL